MEGDDYNIHAWTKLMELHTPRSWKSHLWTIFLIEK